MESTLTTPANVLNLSKRTMKDTEVSLLTRGLNFCPITQFDLFSTVLDVNRLVRSLTLRKHYFGECDDMPIFSCGDMVVGESISSPQSLPSSLSPFSPPFSPPTSLSSPHLFSEVCTLEDLLDLAAESNLVVMNRDHQLLVYSLR